MGTSAASPDYQKRRDWINGVSEEMGGTKKISNTFKSILLMIRDISTERRSILMDTIIDKNFPFID